MVGSHHHSSSAWRHISYLRQQAKCAIEARHRQIISPTGIKSSLETASCVAVNEMMVQREGENEEEEGKEEEEWRHFDIFK